MSKKRTDIEHLYNGNYQQLLHVAQLMLKDEEEARDAVSDVFARLTDGSLEPPEEHPESYLLVATRNLCLDRIRKLTIREKMERSLTLAEPSLTPVETEQEQAAEMIAYARQTFPRQTWRVFQLRYDKGLKYREIADRLDISEVAVYKHLAQALSRLKEKFNPTRQ